MSDYMRLDWSALSVPARVVVIADTHAALDPHVAEALASADAVIHAGDVGGDAVLAAMEAASSRHVAVRGNNDVASKWRGAGDPGRLPLQASIELPGGDLVVVHGHLHNPAARRHAVLRRAFPHARAVVYGHSHRQVCERGGTPWLLNPGAAGRARTFGGAGWLWLSVSAHGAWTVEACRAPP
ncbi:MAG: metallophosphoesterase family protein [Pseudomonadota bacterium]